MNIVGISALDMALWDLQARAFGVPVRGIFESAAMHTPGTMSLDDEDRRELEIIMDDLRPLYRVT